MAHVAFDGFDEVGDEIVAALELHVDLRPGVVDDVAQAHEAVVDRDEPEHQRGQNGEEDEQGHHDFILCWRGRNACAHVGEKHTGRAAKRKRRAQKAGEKKPETARLAQKKKPGGGPDRLRAGGFSRRPPAELQKNGIDFGQ